MPPRTPPDDGAGQGTDDVPDPVSRGLSEAPPRLRRLTPEDAAARWQRLVEGTSDEVAVITHRDGRRMVIEARPCAGVTRGRLTPREREVLRMAATGRGLKDIAHALGIASSTVGTHLASGMKKLGARSLAEIVIVFG